MARDTSRFGNLLAVDRPLAELGVGHGAMLFMWYPFERDVPSAVKQTPFTSRHFGAAWRRGLLLGHRAHG